MISPLVKKVMQGRHCMPWKCLFHQLSSSDVVKPVCTLDLCDCPSIPGRRPGTTWSSRVQGLMNSFSGRPCSTDHLLALIRVPVLILGWSKRIVTVLWRAVLIKNGTSNLSLTVLWPASERESEVFHWDRGTWGNDVASGKCSGYLLLSLTCPGCLEAIC